MRHLAACLFLGLFIAACNLSSTQPREAAIKFLRAVKVADTLAILQGFTLQAPYTILPDTGLWPDGDPRNDTLMAARLLAELLPGGKINQRWLSQRLVVGEADVHGDSAKVEVTALDQMKGTQFYNKFGLVKARGTWRIYSFGTEPGPGL